MNGTRGRGSADITNDDDVSGGGSDGNNGLGNMTFPSLQPVVRTLQKPPPQIQRIQEAALMSSPQQQQQQEQQQSYFDNDQKPQATSSSSMSALSRQMMQMEQQQREEPDESIAAAAAVLTRSRTESLDSASGFLDHSNFNPAVAASGSASTTSSAAVASGTRRRSQRQMKRQEQQQEPQHHDSDRQGTSSSSSAAGLLSRTPPSNVATSYEASHFGKRPRSDTLQSILSERGISVSEFQGNQKGILKDLIISGQDNDLQNALDKYDQGDVSMLEGMLKSGSLPDAAAQEVDLLGNLDFDFLSSSKNRKGSTAGDGIEDMSFNSGLGAGSIDLPGGTRSRSGSTWSETLELMQKHQSQRSRSNTLQSMDVSIQTRERSNSLFSSLIGSTTTNDETNQSNFGRWMDNQQFAAQQQLLLQQQMMQQQAQLEQQQHMDQQAQMGPFDEDDDEDDNDDDGDEEVEDEEDLDERLRQAISGAEKKRIKAQKVQQNKRKRELKREQAKKKKEREKLKKKKDKEKAKAEKEKLKEQKKKKKNKKKKEEAEQQQQAEAEEVVHVPGRPHSPSDTKFFTNTIDEMGLRNVVRPDEWVGSYSPRSRKLRVAKFLEKRNHRVWTKAIKYDVRKNFANTRLRIKGRFVRKEDELLMRELIGIT
eukprot:CAMPEP_0113502636 /NCGR_PEP_ID=MMETSP0014_2-20120614/33681_1 /TAXON_ID=2857 /ORGANISM="Nitzschia sp." /LENGTH=650 /DNA_ID=CAMNT_0000397479 /DNA_START=380 /DNA_END=2332 /DNA_ORIENTATION=- /assembly_acc=CAM_ASM_000159